MSVQDIRSLPTFSRMTQNGVPHNIAESIVRATPPSLGDPLDPVFDIRGTEIKPSDPRFPGAVESIQKDADYLFRAPGQIDQQSLRNFMKSASPIIGIAIMGLKIAGLDDLGEQNRIGGLMRDSLMTFGGPAGMMIAGAMTAVPFIGKGLERTLVPLAEKAFGSMFGALNLGGSNLAGTTVDSTLIDPSNFDPQILDEIMLAVAGDPNFLGYGQPVTREMILNGEVAIPDTFLAEIAGGHSMSLDDARGDSERLLKGEGGVDVGYGRHNISTRGGVLSPQDQNRILAPLARRGITDPGQLNKIRSKMRTMGDLRDFQQDPDRWLRVNGFMGAQGSLARA